MKVKLPFEPSIPAQVAALAALGDQKHLKSTLKENSRGMRYLLNEFNKLNLKSIPTVTNFISIIFENNLRANNFLDKMLQKGILVRGLKSFGLPNSVRISIGTMDENKFFVNNLNNVINEI